MNKAQKAQAITRLMNTSVDDCKSSLEHYHDPGLLCDLLLACYSIGQKSREQVIRRRISRLIKG